MEEYRRRGSRQTGWDLVFEGDSEAVDFFVEDQTGRVAVGGEQELVRGLGWQAIAAILMGPLLAVAAIGLMLGWI